MKVHVSSKISWFTNTFKTPEAHEKYPYTTHSKQINKSVFRQCTSEMWPF